MHQDDTGQQPGKIAALVAVVRQLGLRQTISMLAKVWAQQLRARVSRGKG